MRTINIIIVAAILLFLVVPAAEGQYAVNPNTVPPYYTQPLQTGASYADDQIDTSSVYKLGGTSKLSVIIIANDSVALDFYVDYRVVGTATWTQAYADSLIGTTDSAQNFTEIVIRDNDTDAIDKVGVELRFRQSHRSSGNGTDTATKTATAIWKP